MLNSNSRVRVDDRNVTASVIDGEAIVINLATGLYYSLDQSGAAAWELLSSGHSIAEAAAALAEGYGLDQAPIEIDVLRLAEQLIASSLVTHADADSRPTRRVDLSVMFGTTYATPVFNTYDDMGDVLALDPPLPQVGEQGS